MCRVIFLANMFPEDTQAAYSEAGFVRGGENITFIQRSLIEGLDGILPEPCTIVNKLLVKSGRRRRVPKTEWSHAAGARDVSFSYINLPGLSSNLLFSAGKPWLKRAIRDAGDAKRLVIAYGLTNYTLRALSYAKRRGGAVTALIVPDLPENTKDSKAAGLMKIKNRLTDRITASYERRYLQDVDLLLPFAEKMVPALSFRGKYRVLEGVCTDVFSAITPEKLFENEKTVLYGGGLHRKYGLDILLDAFGQIRDDRLRLVLCGDGTYVPVIRERAAADPRIVYLGRVPRQRLLALQAGADVLVNPRSGTQVFSDFSFPSKNMEYLSSGVPFVGFRLGGIPAEYDPYIHYPADESPQSLAAEIMTVCFDRNESARQTAAQARDFVLNRKNKDVQARMILDAAAAFFA